MRAPGSIRDDTALEGWRGRTRGSPCAAFVLVILGSMLAASSAFASLPSQTDGLIAFQRNDDAQGQIWLADPLRNGPAVKLTSATDVEARPAWGPVYQPSSASSELSDLAFQRKVDGNWDIWRRTAQAPDITTDPPTYHDLGAPEQLVTKPGNQEQPAFSDTLLTSSGTTSLLAYISDDTPDHAREIFLRDAGGTDHQLTSDGAAAGYANPDFAGRFRPLSSGGDPTTGTKTIGLTFEKTSGTQRGIWALDIDVHGAAFTSTDGTFIKTHDPRPVALGPVSLSEPSWQVTSPTNQTVQSNDVLFTTWEFGTTYLDYVEAPAVDDANVIPFLVPAQARRYQLTGDPGGDSGGVWAPFGDQIAFTRTAASNPDLWVMAASGVGLRRLTVDPRSDLYPSWQPAQNSSADLVGGHTAPGPVTRGRRPPPPRNPPPNNPPPNNPPPRRKEAPRLALRGVRWHGGRVTVAGRTARGFRGRVRVAFACGHRRRQHTQRRASARSGRFATRLTVPRACRRARRGVVAVAYGGDRRYRAQKISRRVRRS